MSQRTSAISDNLNALSDEELRRRLLHCGFPNMPVTETTRKILIKKLSQHLSGNSGASVNVSAIDRTKYNYRPKIPVPMPVPLSSWSDDSNYTILDDSMSTSSPRRAFAGGQEFKSPTTIRSRPMQSSQMYDVASLMYSERSTPGFMRSAQQHPLAVERKHKSLSPKTYVPPPILSTELKEDPPARLSYCHRLDQPSHQLSSKIGSGQQQSHQLVGTRWQNLYTSGQSLVAKILNPRGEFTNASKRNSMTGATDGSVNAKYGNGTHPLWYTYARISSRLHEPIGFKQTVVPFILVSLLLIFLAVLTFTYIWIGSDSRNTFDLMNTAYTLCSEGGVGITGAAGATESASASLMKTPAASSTCIRREEVEDAMVVVRRLHALLQARAVEHFCSDPTRLRTISSGELANEMRKTASSDVESRKTLKDIRNAEHLIEQNGHWKITSIPAAVVGTTTALSHENGDSCKRFSLSKPRLPIRCTLRHKLQAFFVIVGLSCLIGAFLLLLHVVYTYMQRRKQRRLATYHEFTNKIIDELMQIAAASSTAPIVGDPSSPDSGCIEVDQLKERIVRRKETESLWNEAIDNLQAKDHRVQFGVRINHDGVECRTIKWIADVEELTAANRNISKQWQSPAFNKTNKILNPPTCCLKIRHMFDAAEANNPHLKQTIIDSILEKVGRNCRVYDIQFDKDSCCVYVRCATEMDAGIVHNEINGWWFDKRLVSIKFVRLQRYLTRFPTSAEGPACLLPSNSKNLSMTECIRAHNKCNDVNDNDQIDLK